jgi:hypothetical protein
MFIEHEVNLAVPIENLETVVLARFQDAEKLGTSIYRNGEELRAKVGLEGPVAKEVVLKLGHPLISRAGLAIPVTWRATGAGLMFPRLTGEIEIRRTSVDRSSMKLQASYDPPFGWMGDILDRLLLERIARLTVVDWLERVAAGLESEFSDNPKLVSNRDGDLNHRADTED